MITSDPAIAKFAIAGGVDRVFVDLELLGKQQRQGHLDTVISRHSLADVCNVRPVVPPGHLLVRINPMHQGSVEEIDQVIDAGADIIMLPMFRSAHEVEAFIAAVRGRARCCLLIETVGAMTNLQECLSVPGVDEAHIGLNDLHLELGLDFMFQPLINGLVEQMCATLRAAGIPFGIGGVARVGEGLLPAEMILSEHVRLGSSCAILSRTFHRQATSVAEMQEHMDFAAEVAKLHAVYARHLQTDASQLDVVRQAVRKSVEHIVAMIRARKGPA